MTRTPPHIAVVGGGITGLAAAHALSRSGAPRSGQLRVTLLEASDRLGGKIRSEPFAGTTVDVGPEALLTTLPAAMDLCTDLGIAQELVAPLASRTTVWTRGRLRELPPGILGGLPDGIGPILRSGILSPAGAARASADLVLPSSDADSDRSVGALVRGRLGRQALERMIDPLLGGIYGGDPDELSLRATAPRLDLLAREHRSLILGLLAAGKQASKPSGPMFMTLPGGLQRLVSRLGADLQGVDVRCNQSVKRLVPLGERRYHLELAAGGSLQADGVILAVPAFAAESLLAESCPEAAAELSGIDYASVAVVWLSFPAGALPPLPPGTGFVVPRAEGKALSACTWASAKWPHLADRGDALLRCSVGRGRPEAIAFNERRLVNTVIGDLREALGVTADPSHTHIARWERALPQYRVGHLERIARLDDAITRLPQVKFAGAAYRGMGVPQCITQGQQAAEQILSTWL